MGERRQISLLDPAVGLAAGGPAGPLYATTVPSPPGPVAGALRAYDTTGRPLWSRRFETPARDLKVGADGEVWIAQGRTLRATAPDGSHLWAVRPSSGAGDRLDAFLVLADGFLLAWRSTGAGGAAAPRIERVERDGSRRWSTTLPPVRLGGWVAAPPRAAGGDRGGVPRYRFEDPHPPSDFRPAPDHPLLLSADRLLATYRDPATGLGVAFCLDTGSGAVAWTTPAHSVGHRAVADAAGGFLIGANGPHSFETRRFDRTGRERDRWACHGMYTVSSTGTVRCLELDAHTWTAPAVRSRLRILDPGGGLRSSGAFGGHHSSHPALTRGRRSVFCRDDTLWVADSRMEALAVGALRTHDRAVLGRVLLLGDGLVAVTRRDELLLFRTGLGPLDDGVWPCAGGGLHGNPVVPPAAAPEAAAGDAPPAAALAHGSASPGSASP